MKIASLGHRAVLVVLAAFMIAPVPAAESDPVIARNSTVEVRLSEFDAEIAQRVPADSREEFMTNRKRVADVVDQLLVRKTLALQAKTEKLDEVPDNAARIQSAINYSLAQFRLAEIEDKAKREFDAKLPQQVARAREIYLVDRKRFATPDEISASHILFDTRKHSSDDARKLSSQARERIVAGTDFVAVAKEMSEDPSVASNGGALGWFTREKVDPAFAAAAFGLTTVGQISDPVQSRFGWHIIRLDGRRSGTVPPFEQVKDKLVAELRAKYVEQQVDAALGAIRDDGQANVNDSAVDEIVAKARTAAAATQGRAKP